MNQILMCILLLMVTSVSHGQTIGFNEKTSMTLIDDSIPSFWRSNSQVIEDGKLVNITPPDISELTKSIIERDEALKILNDSYLVGNAMWCKLEWRDHYLAYMQEQRKKDYSQIQIAYIGFLFGVGQSQLNRTLQNSGKECGLEHAAYINQAFANW